MFCRHLLLFFFSVTPRFVTSLEKHENTSSVQARMLSLKMRALRDRPIGTWERPLSDEIEARIARKPSSRVGLNREV